MKRLIALLCALYLVLAFGTAFAAPATKTDTTSLNDIPPAWSKTLQCDATACPRFELVLGGEAVLDHETGLVWQKDLHPLTFTWVQAINVCHNLRTGGRGGWHLPTIEQLSSLVPLPSGHPFNNVNTNSIYLSATTLPDDTTYVAGITFPDGGVGGLSKQYAYPYWCVRGGEMYDAR